MLNVPVYLNSAADERTNSTFIAPMQSVLYTAGIGPQPSRATVVQRPPSSLYAEAAGILSPWVMPAFTYDVFTALGSSNPDALAVHAALSKLEVGAQIRIGGTDMNKIVATIEEIQAVAELVNNTGSCLALSHLTDELPAQAVPDTRGVGVLPKYLVNGEILSLAATGISAPMVHNRIFRLSTPVDLNTFSPSYFTQRYDKIGQQIYAIDALTGLATDLMPLTSTVTLASRGKAWRMGAHGTNFYERFYWPMYLERATRSTAAALSVNLQNLQQRPVKIALRMFAFHGAIEQDEIVLKLDGVRGSVVSNNATANTAFAVLSTSLPASRHMLSSATAVTVQRSDTLVLAEAPIDTTLRTITARLYDLAGNEVFVPISLMFDLTLKAIF